MVPNSAAPLPLLERLPIRSVHEHVGPEHHYRDGYEAEDLRRLLEAGGFNVETMGRWGASDIGQSPGLCPLRTWPTGDSGGRGRGHGQTWRRMPAVP